MTFVEPVYNIEVDGHHCYRVGQQGLLVHNASYSDPCNAKTVPCYDLFSGCGLFSDPFPGTDSPGKTYLKPDEQKRAKGVRARLCKASIGGGSMASNPDIEGWKEGWGGAIVRAHLLPERLGGPGGPGGKLDEISGRNLVVVCKKTNNQLTTKIEQMAYDRVMAGLIVDYQVDVQYQGDSPYPLFIEVRIKTIDPTKEIPSSGVKPCREEFVRISGVSTDIYDCKDAPPKR